MPDNETREHVYLESRISRGCRQLSIENHAALDLSPSKLNASIVRGVDFRRSRRHRLKLTSRSIERSSRFTITSQSSIAGILDESRNSHELFANSSNSRQFSKIVFSKPSKILRPSLMIVYFEDFQGPRGGVFWSLFPVLQLVSRFARSEATRNCRGAREGHEGHEGSTRVVQVPLRSSRLDPRSLRGTHRRLQRVAVDFAQTKGKET